MTAADEAIVLLVEVIIIVGEVADRHETLAHRLVELHIESPFGHARDHAVVDLSEAVFHEFHLLIADRGALGVGGELLHVGIVAAFILELELVGASAALGIAGEQTMDHHVGIAADRRSEVGVIWHREAVVADIVGGIDSLGHRTDGEDREHVLLPFSLHVAEQTVDALVDLAARAVGGELIAEALGDKGEVAEFLGVGIGVDAIDESLRLLPFRHLSDALGHREVGEKHELLDEFVGIFRLLEIDAHGLAVLVDLEAHLCAVELEGALLVTAAAELLGKRVEGGQLAGELTVPGLDNLLGLLIGEAAVALDHRAADSRIDHVGLLIELEHCGEGELLLVGTQGADAVAEALGEHGDGAVHEIDARGAFLGLLVDHRPGAHIMGDVGDMHSDLPIAVGKLADREGVVEILGVARVDGEGGDAAEILALGHLLFCDTLADLLGCFLHIFGIFVREAELGEDGVHLGVVLPFRSEDVEDFAARVHLVVAPAGDAGHGLVAVLAPFELVARDDDVGGEEFRVGHERRIILVDLDCADKLLLLGLHDLYHAGLGILAAAGCRNNHAHLVAVEGMHRVALGHHDLLVVDHHGVLAVAAAHEIADVLRAAVSFRLVSSEIHLHDVADGGELVEDVDHIHAQRPALGADAKRYLLIVEALLAVRLKKLHHLVLKLLKAATAPAAAAVISLFHIYDVFLISIVIYKYKNNCRLFNARASKKRRLYCFITTFGPIFVNILNYFVYLLSKPGCRLCRSREIRQQTITLT